MRRLEILLPLKLMQINFSRSRQGGCREEMRSRPTVPCDGAENEPVGRRGCLPRPFRHLRMTEHRTPDPSSSQAPVHSALVQKSVTRHHQPGRPAFRLDAKARLREWQEGKRKKMAGSLQLK